MKKTRFILRLIQTTDDTRYEDYIEPTVAFTVALGSIRVDCKSVASVKVMYAQYATSAKA